MTSPSNNNNTKVVSTMIMVPDVGFTYTSIVHLYNFNYQSIYQFTWY